MMTQSGSRLLLDQFGLSCARVEGVSPDERLNAARQVRDKIYKNALDQFGLSCARVEGVSLDERLNAARQVRDKIYKNALRVCPEGSIWAAIGSFAF